MSATSTPPRDPQSARQLPHRVTVGSPVVSALDLVIVAGVALAAGVINSIAGGGSLILFPTLVALGLGTVAANVTNSVAQWPGYLGGIAGFRGEYGGQRGRLIRFGTVAVLGGTTGSVLLLTTPSEAFDVVVPVLVLLASLLLAVQPLISRRLQRDEADGARPDPAWLYVALFCATVYGGYFGGALGIVLLALLGALLADELQRLNALKGLISLVVGIVAAAGFAIFGPVAWGAAALVAGGALVGGRAGVGLARRLRPVVLRWAIIAYGVTAAIILIA
jgi:uncharacterized protein